MSYVVYHDHKPAHSSEKEADQNRQSAFTFCERCKDWFKPSRMAETKPSPAYATTDNQ